MSYSVTISLVDLLDGNLFRHGSAIVWLVIHIMIFPTNRPRRHRSDWTGIQYFIDKLHDVVMIMASSIA